VRQLIKRILKEEREKDLSLAIKELLNDSLGPKYKGIICKFDAVAPWKMYEDPFNRDYQVMVSVIGGVGSNRWPNTMNFVKERDKIVNETWHTIYNFLGISTDVFLRNVKSCDEVMSEGLKEQTGQDNRPNKIMKMIDDIGLYNTVKMVGGYESLLNYINPEDITESDKIKFIRDVVTSKGPEISGRNNISIFDLGIKPIWYDEYKNRIRVITTMYGNGAKLNVYINETYDDSGNMLYTHMPEDVIDRVFKVMTNVLDDKKEEMTEEMIESDPKVGTGKKPKDSDRRLYTDENPNDTVSVKFRTKQDIIDTLSKDSFKSRPHARQSQIINLIHQRLRVALERAKDPEVKNRLRTAFEYIETRKEKSKKKTEEMREGEITERCWKGYTQKGMKTMFGKRYPNCVKKTK
jgi:hypothetical protein